MPRSGTEPQGGPELTVTADSTTDTPSWLLLGGAAAVVAVGAGLAFAPSRKTGV